MSTNYGWGAGEMEGPFEYGQQEGQYGEFEGQNGESSQEAEGVFGETEEMELAADMLSLGSEMELEQAIGNLMNSAARAVGGSITPDVGAALGNAIKAAAKQTAPMSGAPAAASGELFGIEPEGLSGEDQEFEVMRRFVRWAGAAASRAARSPRGINPRAIVRSALTSAARRWAPGLLRQWNRGYGYRNQGWQRRRWHHRHQRWGTPGYGYGYPYSNQYQQPYQQQPYPQPYPGAPGFPGAQQQPSPFDPNAAGGFGGAPDASGGAMTQGMPDSGGQDFAPGGGEGPVPQSGRWTRQNGQLTIHL